jgi:hypothetical protein
LRPADAIDSNHHPTRARHPDRPTRTASWPPSDSANRTINTLDSSANPPAPANPSLVCLPSPVSLPWSRRKVAAFPKPDEILFSSRCEHGLLLFSMPTRVVFGSDAWSDRATVNLALLYVCSKHVVLFFVMMCRFQSGWFD